MPRPAPAPQTQLGALIQARRAETDLRALAERLGLSHTTLSRLERGRVCPSPQTALALARWLECDLARVFEAASAPVPSPP